MLAAWVPEFVTEAVTLRAVELVYLPAGVVRVSVVGPPEPVANAGAAATTWMAGTAHAAVAPARTSVRRLSSWLSGADERSEDDPMNVSPRGASSGPPETPTERA